MLTPLPGGRELRDLWGILLRRQWIVWLSFVLCGTLALVGSFLVTPLYRATVTLHIERQNPDILTFRDLSTMDYSWVAYGDFYETQYKILQSASVARRAVERLELTANPAFEVGRARAPGLLSRIRALLPRKVLPAELSPEERATMQLLGALEIAPVRNSQLVRVSWVSADPALAAQVANAIAAAYIELNIEARFTISDQAEEFLVDQIGSLKREIQAIEERLQEYGEAKRIVSIDDSNNVTMQALQDIAQRLTAAQTQLAQAEARHEALRAAAPEALPQVLESPLIARLRGEHAQYEAQHSETAERFKEDWPGLAELRSKLGQAGARLELETTRIAEQVRAAAEADSLRARQEVIKLERLLGGQQDAAQRLKRDSVEFANLRSEVQKKRETLDSLMQRQNEMALSTRLADLETTSTNVRIMDAARPPVAPFRPDTRLNLIIGLFCGSSLGLVLAFLLDSLDNTIGSPSELERVVELPILAVVPRHRPGAQMLSRARRESAPEVAIDAVTREDPRAPASEAYRELRTSILLSHAGEPPRRIMVTSAIPEEGKTSTAMNLASVLAQLGRRVVLVDTDLRRPRLHKALGVDNTRGVSTYLSGLAETHEELVVPSGQSGLDLLPSGPIPPNPSELLNSVMFTRLCEELIDSGYDHLIFDSPPALSVSDPVVIAATVDVRVLVVRAGHCPRQSIRLAADKLRQAGSPCSGIVLNDVDLDRLGGRYYGYQYLGDEPRSPVAAKPRRGTRASGSG